MGLFDNKKKLCPICGNPTPRLLATKIEGTPICKECFEKVDLPDGMVDNMSMSEFRNYITYYENNQVLRDRYKENCRQTFGLFTGGMAMDTYNRLFRLNIINTGLVMEASNLKKFRILEGGKPLFEGTAAGLRVYDTGIEERVSALQPQLMMYKREMERRKEDRDGDGKPDNKSFTNGMLPELPLPFQKFQIELTLEHPYWQYRTWEMDGPMFDRNYPRIDSYLNQYRQMAEELRAFALNLMHILNPAAGEITEEEAMAAAIQAAQIVNREPVAAQSANAVEEIKKYKDLLDAGIITEEEFSAKKRQLMGI